MTTLEENGYDSLEAYLEDRLDSGIDQRAFEAYANAENIDLSDGDSFENLEYVLNVVNSKYVSGVAEFFDFELPDILDNKLNAELTLPPEFSQWKDDVIELLIDRARTSQSDAFLEEYEVIGDFVFDR